MNRDRPIVKVEPARPPDTAAAARRAAALASAAELGILEAARQRDEARALAAELLDALTSALERGDELPRAVVARTLDALEAWFPRFVGPYVVCGRCGQIGRASELVAGRIAWEWSGSDALGAVVHPVRVVQARAIGDQPPRLCPDHEREGVAAGKVPGRVALELTREALR